MFKSSYTELPERFYEHVEPEVFAGAKMLLVNEALANQLDLQCYDETEMAKVCSGQSFLPGSRPAALAYAGSQFGHFVPLLGDGRAHLLGESHGFDIQLKGSGRTRFSRNGDGRSALGPVIREFLVSEAMHALGVPTTRSLCIISTGEQVYRQSGAEPGGILARVAESHIRVGTFQYFAARGDIEALEILTDYTIQRHYPEIQTKDLSGRCLALLQSFAERQRDLVAKWYGLGFIHGVMNTDNCSLAGITLDYGPCAFMDEFRFMKVFSSIDAHGRYAYGNQMPIIEWNILRLADCLLPLIADDDEIAAAKVKEALEATLQSFLGKIYEVYAQKLGLTDLTESDASLAIDFLRYLEAHELDFTLGFSNLEALYAGASDYYPETAQLQSFLARWRELGPDLSGLASINPQLIPRNHQIQNVIDQAYAGDYGLLRAMWEAVKSPYAVSETHQPFVLLPEPNERIQQTFCGT